tara:strand:+ start:1308 stop:1598 length:291 start_codon:yes stop_codon:yes gene_type:complete
MSLRAFDELQKQDLIKKKENRAPGILMDIVRLEKEREIKDVIDALINMGKRPHSPDKIVNARALYRKNTQTRGKTKKRRKKCNSHKKKKISRRRKI